MRRKIGHSGWAVRSQRGLSVPDSMGEGLGGRGALEVPQAQAGDMVWEKQQGQGPGS